MITVYKKIPEVAKIYTSHTNCMYIHRKGDTGKEGSIYDSFISTEHTVFSLTNPNVRIGGDS